MLEAQAQLGLSEQALPQSLISDTQAQVNLRNRLTGKLEMERDPEAQARGVHSFAGPCAQKWMLNPLLS